MLRIAIFAIVVLLACSNAEAQRRRPYYPVPEPTPFVAPQPKPHVDQVPQSMQLSPETRAYCRNPDGSCVQCSIVMCGFHSNDPKAATLLWDTEYGPAVRGGSWPSRVSDYCNKRGIKAWNITGWPATKEWMIWSAVTGRFCAIGAGSIHFQTLYSYDPNAAKPWGVCNNNSTNQIDYYTDKQFEQLHLASGAWCVILEKPSSENPVLFQWWE